MPLTCIAHRIIIHTLSVSTYPVSTEDCRDGIIFIAEEFMSGQNTTAVRVTLKHFSNQSNEQSLPIPGVRLPTNCGRHFSRCNMTLVTNHTTASSILLVPLQQGIAQIEYSDINRTLQETYHILRLPSEVINSCQVTTLLDITEFTNQRSIINIIGQPLPRVLGICLNENGIKLINVTIDFENVLGSSLSLYMSSAFNPSVTSPLSNFLYTSDLPYCWLENVNSLTYYVDTTRIGLFDVTGIGDVDDFTLLYQGANQECNNPRQLIRISDLMLVIYCEDSSAEINMCNFGAHSVEISKLYEANSETGIPYYCSSDMYSFVMVNNRTITYNSSFSVVSRNLSLAADEDVYIGNCIQNGDEVFFVFTTTLGSVYLFNLTRQDISEEEVILGGVNNNVSFIQHHLYYNNDIVVYNNGSATILHNITCRDSIATINHQYQLSLVVPNEGQHPCTCRRPSSATDTTTPPPSSSPSPPVHKLSRGAIAGIVLGSFIILVIGIVVVISVMIKKRQR